MSPRRGLLVALLAVLAVACTRVPGPAALKPVEESPRPPSRAALPGAVDYRIDSAQSQLRVLVYRSGPLAALGHNHVIVDSAISGWIHAASRIQDSSFYLQLAPGDFVVDPPAARAEEGPDFAAVISDEARAGTRRNLLGPAQLDAQQFPAIRMQSVSIQRGAAGAGPAATLRITIAGRTRLLTLPFTFEREANTLHVGADLRLNQTALGLEPLRVLLGQLQVQDEMHLKLDIRALADQAPLE